VLAKLRNISKIDTHFSFIFPIFATLKQLVGLSLAPCAYEESPGNTEHPTS